MLRIFLQFDGSRLFFYTFFHTSGALGPPRLSRQKPGVGAWAARLRFSFAIMFSGAIFLRRQMFWNLKHFVAFFERSGALGVLFYGFFSISEAVVLFFSLFSIFLWL